MTSATVQLHYDPNEVGLHLKVQSITETPPAGKHVNYSSHHVITLVIFMLHYIHCFTCVLALASLAKLLTFLCLHLIV